MPTLTTKSFTTLIQEWAAVVQASITATRPTLILNFTKGSILRALAEAQASVSLWLEGLILKLLTSTRLTSAQGIDVDTFCADWMPPAVGGQVLPSGQVSPRLPAIPASGPLTFSRNIPTNPAFIPVGALVQSADGTQTYTVTNDPTNSAYTATGGPGNTPGYIIPAAISSISVPIAFTFPSTYVAGQYTGPVGNVQSGAITILQTGISGVDTITNLSPIQNGGLAESDGALKARFPLFVASLAKGTEGAIGAAVQGVQQGMQYQIWEPGIAGFTVLTVYVDDGSGAIPTATLQATQAAANSVKAAGVQMNVIAATALLANVTMTITTAAGYYHPTVVAQVVGALTLYINSIGLGQVIGGVLVPGTGSVSYAKLNQIAFEASPGVIDVTGYSLNGVQSDLIPAAGQTIKAGAIIVS